MSTTPVPVTIELSDGTVISNSLTTVYGTPLSYTFTPVGVSANVLNTVLSGRGLIVKALSPVGVQVRNIASDNVTCNGACYGTVGSVSNEEDCTQKGNSAFTSLGDQGLGTSFRIGYYANVTGSGWNCNNESQTPIYAFMAVYDGTNLYLNGKLITTLNAGQSYLFQSSIGSEVTSNSPIVGTSGMRIDNTSGCGDGVCGQMIPEDYLGEDYIIVRSTGTAGYEQSTIVATAPNTTVTVSITGGATKTYTLATAGSYVTIPNGDGSNAYSTCYVTANSSVAVYSGSASGCEIDMIVQPPITTCAGSFDVQTTKFVSNVNTGDETLPYFGYILVQSDTAIVYFNGVNLETLTSKRTPVANSGFYIIQFTNTQLGNPTFLNFLVNARVNVAMVESGSGFSMSSFISSISNSMPPPAATSSCLPSVFTAQGGFASYQWYLNNAPISGATYQTYTPTTTGIYSVAGNSLTCGSTTISPTVTVNAKPTVSVTSTACSGTSVSLTGSNPSTANWIVGASNPSGATLGNTTNGAATVVFGSTAVGTYNFIYNAGCSDTAAIVVKATSTSTTRASICNGASYLFNGTSYTTAGTYTVHLTNAAGCDSAATLVLTVKSLSSSTTNANICTGSSYTFNGTAYNTSGTYTVHLTNSAGCDSAATLVLTVNSPSTSTTNASICTGSSYSFNGVNYTTAGTRTVHLTNAVGCDSAATLVLTVNSPSSSTTTASICSGSSYRFNGTDYTSSGTYTSHLTNSVGCDSAATLVLTVKSLSTSTTSATIPLGNTYTFNGTTYTSAGTYTVHLINSVGCDSAATLVLTVYSYSNTTASICAGGSYTFNGTAYSTSGTYTAQLTSSKGTDSVATLILTVKPTSTSTTNASICNGSSYTFNGTAYTNAGTYVAHLTNSVGCDSAATLILTVKSLSTSTTNASICNGSSYTFNGTTYTTPGTYTVHLTNSVGCDSAATLVLTVKSLSTSTTTASICSNSSYIFNGTTYTTSGTYVAHLTNSVGCDSAATLVLTVKSTSTSTTNISICSGGSYTFNGTTYTTAGTYTVHFTNSVGCDSAATLVLKVNANPTVAAITGTSSFCAGSTTTLSDATSGGVWSSGSTSIASVNASGVVTGVSAGAVAITYTVTNSNGCSSSVNTNLVVNALPAVSPITGTSNVCVGGTTALSDITYGGTWSSNGTNIITINSSGVVTGVAAGNSTVSYTLASASGCSTTVSSTIFVNVPTTSTTNATICSGSSYTFNGNNYTTAGSYIVHLTNANGCDSAATLVLTVKSLSTSTTTAAICNGSSYTFNGTTYTTAGTYVAHLTNSVGCDSAATLVLTVKSLSTSTTAAAICSGGSYTFNGTAYTTAGTYVAHLTNAVGCDSAATLVLTVKSLSTSTTNAAICNGSSYTFNGTAYTTAGTYVAHLTNAVGCDSAATLVLTVKSLSTSTTTAAICNGGSYTFNGTAYTTAGTYVTHLTNSVGCDSAATLVLTVKSLSTSTTTAAICNGSSYTFNGTAYSTAGTYVAHLTNAVGCDSAATLVLTVKALSTSTTTAAICAGGFYTFNGTTYTTAGTYVAHLTNAVGCDSAATLVLTVKSLSTSTTNAAICNSGSYTFNGTTYTTAGTYVAHLTNSVGCDSAATLVLTVKSLSTSTTTAAICSGGSYTFNGTAYTTAGTYVAHLTNSVGCDSAATLVLTVKALSTSTTTAAICNGGSYTFNGTAYSTAGTYVAHLTNSVGCDSAATLVLTVKSLSTSTTNAAICNGSSYTFNGTAYTTAGTYVAHLTNAVGCDSAATLVLTVKSLSTSTTTAAICSGGSYTFNGTTYTTAGTYVAHLTNAVGCDSAATLVLTVKSLSTSTTNASICNGGSYTFNGTSYTAAGTYVAHLTNSVGCDSAATLVLTVNALSTSTTNASICNGGSYTFNGTTYMTAGTYVAHLTNAVGCDSAATLVLTVKSLSTSSTSITACSSYVWNGNTYTTSGTYTYHTSNAVGCDSTATLVLTINEPTTSSTSITACSSYVWNGNTYTTSGTYTYHTSNAVGCDSTATLVLTINEPTTSSTSITACSSYVWNGNTYTTSGTYTYHTLNAVGCDSTATLVLTINQPSTSSTSIIACSNYVWNGNTYTTSGTYTYHTLNAVGCDSTATLVLTINVPTTSSNSIIACTNYAWNGTTYTTSGNYTYHTLNAVGCDSTATLNLTINQPTISSTSIIACSSYVWNGNTYTNSGTYTYHTLNAVGCDSTATLVLTINQPSTSSTNITACSSYVWNGNTYTTSGTYTYHTLNAVGCDSAATLNLTINQPTTSYAAVNICSGGTYIFNGISYSSAGTYVANLTNSAGCDSTATLVLTVNNPSSSTTTATICDGNSYSFNGNIYSVAGTFIAHLTNSVGCDSAATLILTVNPTPAFATINGKDSLCAGSVDSLSASITGGVWANSTPSIATIDSIGNVSTIASGNDTISYTLTNTCGTATATKVIYVGTTIPSVQLIAGTSTACPGYTSTLTDATLGGYWTSADTSIAVVDSTSGVVTGVATGTANIIYTAVSVYGCTNSTSVPFTVNCGSVTSAGDGGLESKSMGEAVATRVYNRALANTVNTVDYNTLPAVEYGKKQFGVMGIATPGSQSLTDLMPSINAIGTGYNAYDMSAGVADLPAMTNASIAKAYDYVADNSTKSATLITRTYGLVYQHTKPICDRLKEATLLDVRTVTVQGMDFIQYKLLQNTGQIEYAISFSAGIQNNIDSFRIQSVWLTKNFINQDTMYNFQIWAIDPVMAKNMLNNVLNKLNNLLPLSQINKQGVPSTYITNITRNQNKLVLNITNNTSATSATLNLSVTSNETTTVPTLQTVPVTLLPNATSQVIVDLQDNFESDVNLYVGNNQTDLAYMNDGNWNYSLSNSSTQPNAFTVTNDGIMPDSGELRLFRTVNINVNVPDYVSVYKMMKAGGLSRDLTGYSNLLFTASATGSGTLKITIQKNSISNWNNQYSYTIPVSANTTSYAVKLRDFTSAGSTDTLTANDVVTVTFSFIGDGSGNINATIFNAKFTAKDYVYIDSLTDKTISAYPNPTSGNFTCSFKSNVDTKLTLKIVQLGTGRVVYSQNINAVTGQNIVPIYTESSLIADGYYILELENAIGNYIPYKMLFKR